MKSIFGVSLAAIFLFAMPFSDIQAQEKKTEQKIKIITDDGSGKTVVIDTVFTGKSPDSLKLKDGSTIYITHDSQGSDMVRSEGAQHIYVTSSDSKDGNRTSEITIIQSDSLSAGKGEGSDKFIWVDKDDSAADRSRYVIAKDGMVITIEGNDEAKTKALAKDIEEKLGVKSEESK